MAPIPRIRLDETLPSSQPTTFSALNRSLSLTRPPPPPRTSPKPKSSGQSSTAFRRRLVGGIFKRQTIKLFANARLVADQGERGDEDIT